MHHLVLATLFALVATVASAQRMGGSTSPMSTSDCFPLIDGARYEYAFIKGPRATATAVMHGGQTWAGVGNVTGVHMRSVCQDGTPCVVDQDDFYASGPDGVRWHGGRSSTVDGPHFMTSLTHPPGTQRPASACTLKSVRPPGVGDDPVIGHSGPGHSGLL